MRWMGTALAVAVMMLMAAGCGGSSNESSSASTDTTGTETTSTQTTSGDETSTESTEPAESTETSAAESTGLTGACKDLVEVGQKYSEALAEAGSGADADIDVTAETFSAFADRVPEEVRDDFQTLADAFAAYANAVKGLDLKAGQVPNASQIAKLTAAMKSFNTGDVNKASTNIQEWVTKNCGTQP